MPLFLLLAWIACVVICPLDAQVSWWAEREEPEMISVSGTLANPKGVSVEFRNPVTHHVRRLMGWEAMVFLQMRNYVAFNEQAGHFQVTEKYRAWQKRPKPVAIQPPPLSQFQGLPVALGTTSMAPAQQWQKDELKKRLWDLYNRVWKPLYDTPPPPRHYGAYAIDVARTIQYHIDMSTTEEHLARVENFWICMDRCVMANKQSTNAAQVNCTAECRRTCQI